MSNNFFQGKRILVTGGTGFVGSHVVESLVKQKADVVTTYLSRNEQSYFSSCQLQKKVTCIQSDICDFTAVYDIITRHDIDFIFHLAAQALVNVAVLNPLRTFSTNVMGTVNILEAARLLPEKIKGVVVASSDKAYGKLPEGKYIETHPLQGDHPYEASKSSADLISYSYFKTYGVPVTVTRFGNIYGEGDLNFSRIIPAACQSFFANSPLELRSDGTHVRDFLYVKDVVSGYLSLAQHIDKTQGEAFNFGSEDTFSVKEMLKIMETSLQKNLKTKILNTARNEIPYQSLDYIKIKKLLGWSPEHRLSDTLPKIYDWYKEYFLSRS